MGRLSLEAWRDNLTRYHGRTVGISVHLDYKQPPTSGAHRIAPFHPAIYSTRLSRVGRSSRAPRGPTIARVRFSKFVLTAFRAVDLEDIGYLNAGSDGLLFVASAQPALVRLSVVRNAGANYLFGFGSQLNSPILTRYLPRCREQQNNWSELFAYFTSSGRRVIAK